MTLQLEHIRIREVRQDVFEFEWAIQNKGGLKINTLSGKENKPTVFKTTLFGSKALREHLEIFRKDVLGRFETKDREQMENYIDLYLFG